MKKGNTNIQASSTATLCEALHACRMCKSRSFVSYLDLGHTPPADQFRRAEELGEPEVSYPLRVVLCKECGLSQLSHVVDPRVLYQHEYPYESSVTKTGAAHWAKFAEDVISRLGLKPGSLVLDIGSNDGTLLLAFKARGMRVVGVDPAPNIVALAKKRGVPTYCDFFGPEVARRIQKKYGTVSAVVGTNVFAHIHNLENVMRSVGILLDKEGAFLFESPYFQHLVDGLEYDTIYHEHLSYLSLTPVVRFAKRFKFDVFAVEESAIHGGSFRVYMSRSGRRVVDKSVKDMLTKEKKNKLNSLSTLRAFAERVEENRHLVMSTIENLLAQGKKIVAVSAPAKGMTLLNYCGLTKRHLAFVTEKSALKIGRFTPGAYIPIVADSELISQKPDYALLLAWNFSKEIMHNNRAFTEAGGKFIIPIPKPRIEG